MQAHRPEVFRILAAAELDESYVLVCVPSGAMTILRRQAGVGTICLSPDHDPLGGVARLGKALESPIGQGHSLALAGIGDGYFLKHLAGNPPSLFLNMTLPVFVIEPDPRLALLAMAIHDYTGPAGPIEQERFQWFIGAGWQPSFSDAIVDEPMLQFPVSNVNQSLESAEIAVGIQQALADLLAADAANHAVVAEHCGQLSRQALIELFGDHPPRRPRALLITTRFSTVLQHSTRDAAKAFTQLGWEAMRLIEPTGHHRITRAALRAAMASFKPDLVFQIDHLRDEHGDVFPATVPFACWIQDHLDNLTSRSAGDKIATRDYVLTTAGAWYSQRYGYPPRQCISLGKLTRIPKAVHSISPGGEDLVYVSNASESPAASTKRILQSCASAPGATRRAISRCSAEMIDEYARGGSVTTRCEVAARLDDALRTERAEIASPAGRDAVLQLLFEGLNNALYRQQALAWAATAAATRGLRLSIYGSGWEDHPQFAPYARGSVQYGPALEELTRRARINFQIVPYSCFHQRLLDGLAAGGFFLIRRHPYDTLTQELSNFLRDFVDPAAQTTAQARRCVATGHKEALEALLGRCTVLGDYDDPVQLVRSWERAGQLIPGDSQALPRLNEVSFDDSQSLQSAIERFIHDPALRGQIAEAQRLAVESRLSYLAGVSRTLAAIGQRLRDEDLPLSAGRAAA